MADSETQAATLPVPVSPTAPRPSLARHAPASAFISQLLAERGHLPPQRARRRATPQSAASAYTAGARATIRRMPAGYRTTIVT